MSRSHLAFLALAGLVLLTGLTAWQAEASASPLLLASLALAKVGIIGWVFLELDRSWPGWAVLSAGLVLAIAVGAAWLSSG